MAANNRQGVEQEIKDLASIAEVAFKNISENVKDIFEEALLSGEKVISSLTKDMAKNINSLARDSNKLIINQSRINQGLYTFKDVSEQILANEDKLYTLEQQKLATTQAINDDVLLSEDEKRKLIEDINKEYNQSIEYNQILVEKLQEQAEQLKIVEKRTGLTAKILMGLKRIPIVGDILNIDKGLENMRKKALETGNVFKLMGTGIKGVFEGIEKASVFFAAVAVLKKVFDFFKDAMFAADERVTKMAKGLAFSKDEARALYNNFKDSKYEINSIYKLTKDYTEAFTDLIDLSDFAVIANEKMVETQIILTKNLGLSKEEAFGVQDAFAASNVEADKGLEMVSEQVAAFSNQNKLLATNKKTLADIAKTSKLIQINFNGNLNSLVKTTLEAKKLGLTLGQVSKIGSSLLNFEQSISSELEAELLTGRDLNLERARAYALNHDIAGLTQEISRQGITQEKFANMNVIQQEAIARALGMSAEEMGDMLYKQKIIAKYGGDTLKNLKAQIEQAKKLRNEQNAIVLQKKYDAIEQGILDGKSALEAEKSATAQEKFNQSLEQAKEIFSDFVDGGALDKFADFLVKFVESVGIKGIFRTLTGGLVNDIDIAKYKAEQKQQEIDIETDPEKKKQLQNELNELTKNITETIQKENTAYRTKVMRENPTGEEAKLLRSVDQGRAPRIVGAKDFIIKTLPEDTVVAAGGTSLGNSKEMVQLLTEQNRLLAGILNKEGIITLNGTKMGTAMAVGGYKVQ